LQGVVNVGAVDMTEHQSVGAPYGIQGFPTIKIFGSNKQKPQDYQGTVSFVFISRRLSYAFWLCERSLSLDVPREMLTMWANSKSGFLGAL